ncbi:MAG: hypothetical protein CFH21_00170 [Alphaproteobacteria bacterium MarineAlpha5_Bin11]|nr:MAG: hypothetical protein CFH21_00170 [Alphaproteobacteria bacterium MarineAlpha5_Bin11]
MIHKNFHIFLFIILIGLQSCSPMGVINTTVGAGTVVAESGRTVGEAVDDTGIKIHIAQKFIKSSKGIFVDIDTSVRAGTVLLTGIVEDQETRIEAVKLVWEVEGVNEVINEIEVGNKQNLKEYAKDLWISTKVRAMTLDELGLDVITYNFETINGKVHVMGIARNLEESNRVINTIRRVRGVKEVANHIILPEA